ncbi:CU044_2847 family protein [Arthrobacter celericrescens]|uniref:CU044_2847 family protein n=1 Tax=Arthrobacter celericrescens TaxID=2320851 RepID=UPI000EA04E2C|nr:CU044_2847 family protein [Arthrobacter celericrescens]
MTQLIQYTTDGDGTVLIEVSGSGVLTRGGNHSANDPGVFARAQQTFERALSNVRPAVQGVIDELLRIDHRPDEVSVEFGIDLHAEAGAFIAAASAKSNFNVTMKWTKGLES